jgi:hypothetical protein
MQTMARPAQKAVMPNSAKAMPPPVNGNEPVGSGTFGVGLPNGPTGGLAGLVVELGGIGVPARVTGGASVVVVVPAPPPATVVDVVDSVIVVVVDPSVLTSVVVVASGVVVGVVVSGVVVGVVVSGVVVGVVVSGVVVGVVVSGVVVGVVVVGVQSRSVTVVEFAAAYVPGHEAWTLRVTSPLAPTGSTDNASVWPPGTTDDR